MSASESLSCLRNRALRGVFKSFEYNNQNLYGIVREPYNSDPKHEISIPNPSAISRKLSDIQQSLNAQEKILPINVPHPWKKRIDFGSRNEFEGSVEVLNSIVDSILQIKTKDPLISLSSIEKVSIANLIEILIQFLVDIICKSSASAWEIVRIFFLELIVSSHYYAGKLAFTMLFNVSVRLEILHDDYFHCNLLGFSTMERRNDKKIKDAFGNELFDILLGMLDKLVTMHGTVDGSEEVDFCLNDATGCLLYFTSCRDVIMANRIILIKPDVIWFLLKHITQKKYLALEYRLIEILVFMMYIDSQVANHMNDSTSKTLAVQSTQEEAQVDKKSKIANKSSCLNDFTFLFPGESFPSFPLNIQSVSKFGGLSRFLARFYTTSSFLVQNLIFMVIFDISLTKLKEKKREITSGDETEIYSLLSTIDLTSGLISHPYCLFEKSIARLTFNLWSSPWYKSNKSFQENAIRENTVAILQEIRITSLVEEVYLQSLSLKKYIVNIRQTIKDSSVGPEKIIQKIDILLESNNIEKTFQGEYWLSELLAFGVSNGKVDGGKLSSLLLLDLENNDEELEETLVVDEIGEIRALARAKFWELGKSSNTKNRISFVRVLKLFVRRRLSHKEHRTLLISILRETNTCLLAIVKSKESQCIVLYEAMELIIELCIRPVSYYHMKKTESFERAEKCSKNYHIDGYISLFLSGGASLNINLLREISPEIFLHILNTLDLNEFGNSNTTQMDKLASNNLMSMSAMVSAEIFKDEHTWNKFGGFKTFLPYLQSPHTHVLFFMSQLIISKIKALDEKKYFSSLRKLISKGQQTANEKLVENSYFLCQTLLLKQA